MIPQLIIDKIMKLFIGKPEDQELSLIKDNTEEKRAY